MKKTQNNGRWFVDNDGNVYEEKRVTSVTAAPATEIIIQSERRWLQVVLDILFWAPFAVLAVWVSAGFIQPPPKVEIVEVPSAVCDR